VRIFLITILHPLSEKQHIGLSSRNQAGFKEISVFYDIHLSPGNPVLSLKNAVSDFVSACEPGGCFIFLRNRTYDNRLLKSS
jgi:hypothetical protein